MIRNDCTVLCVLHFISKNKLFLLVNVTLTLFQILLLREIDFQSYWVFSGEGFLEKLLRTLWPQLKGEGGRGEESPRGAILVKSTIHNETLLNWNDAPTQKNYFEFNSLPKLNLNQLTITLLNQGFQLLLKYIAKLCFPIINYTLVNPNHQSTVYNL